MPHLLNKNSVRDFLFGYLWTLLFEEVYLSLQFQFKEGNKSRNVQNAQYAPRTQAPPVITTYKAQRFQFYTWMGEMRHLLGGYPIPNFCLATLSFSCEFSHFKLLFTKRGLA